MSYVCHFRKSPFVFPLPNIIIFLLVLTKIVPLPYNYLLQEQKFDDVQQKIEDKVDKTEMSSMKDLVNRKLKEFETKLNKKEAEAVATKLKLLR